MRQNANWVGVQGGAAGAGAQLVAWRLQNASATTFEASITASANNLGQVYLDTDSARLKFSDGTAWRRLVSSVSVNGTSSTAAGPASQPNGSVNGLILDSSGTFWDPKLTMLSADASNSGAMSAAHYNLLANATRNDTANTIVYRDNNKSFAVSIIEGLADLIATDPGHRAVNKNYVDSVASGLSVRAACRVRSQGNINIASPPAAIDGVTLSNGDRVLCDQQTTTTEDGIYVFNGAGVVMTRAADFQSGISAAGTFTFIQQGTDDNKGYVCSNNKPNDVVGTNDLVFVQFSGAGTFTAGNGLVLAGSTFHFATSSNYSSNTIPYASGTTTIAFTNAGTAGQALIAGSPPAFGALNINSTNNVSGALRLGNGGLGQDNSAAAQGGIAYVVTTGASGTVGFTSALTGMLRGNGTSAPTAVTGTQYGVAYWSSTSAIGTSLAPASTNVFLRGNNAGAPTWSAINLNSSDVTNILQINRGGTGVGSFITGSVIFMGATTLAEDNPNFFWDDTVNGLGLRNSAAATETLTIGAGGWRINNGAALAFSAEMFGMWQAAYGGTWSRGIGWVGSSGTVGAIIGGTGTNDVFSHVYIGPNEATAWVKITTAGQLQVITQGAGAGILIGGDAQIYRSAANVLQCNQLTVDISDAVTAAFRADATNIASQAAFIFYNLAADANPLFIIRRNSTVDAIMEWGAGGASTVDTNLYRSSANTLKTDDNFVVGTLGAGATNTVVTHSSGTLQTRTVNSAIWNTGLTYVDATGGVANKLAKFSDADTITSSNITDNGTSITVAPATNGLITLTTAGTGYITTNASYRSTGDVQITGGVSTTIIFRMFVTGDTVNRFHMDASGAMNWGAGGASAVDTNLYRSAASTLRTDDTFIVGGTNFTMITVPSGSTNTVAVWSATSTGNLQYRTIDARVWGSTLVDASGGIANRVAKFSDADTVTVSNITDDGTTLTLATASNGNVVITPNGTGNVGILTAPTSTGLDINGQVRIRSANFLQFGGTGAADYDTNLYRGGANLLETDDTFVAAKIGIGNSGTFSTSTSLLEVQGHASPKTDNTYDLGESGSFRWRNIRGVDIYGNITPTGFTQNSVIFAGTGGVLSQNNTNFAWDNTAFTLAIGAAQTTVRTAVSLTCAARGSAGITNSHRIEFRAQTYDTVAHYSAWQIQAEGLTNAGSGQFTFVSNQDGSASGTQFAVLHTASAVNYLRATGSATTAKFAQLEAVGTDTDIGISFKTKGAVFTTSGNSHSVHNVQGRLTWNDGAAAKPSCSLLRTVVVNLNGVDVDRSNAVPTLGTSIVVVHNLGNANAWVFLVNTGTNEVEMADVTQTTANSVTLGFTQAPASGTYRAVVFG